MVIKNISLETVCGITSSLPVNVLPEIAFAGKSNVGKSSLINALMNRKSFARVSEKPGKTQTINFYNINDVFYLVDLPGYGFAQVSMEVRKKWGDMIERYLKKSAVLKAVFLLVDIRHEPSANDKNMYDWIVYNGYEPIIIATKADKISKMQVNRSKSVIAKKLGAPIGDIIPFSAPTKQGLEDIWKRIDDLVIPSVAQEP